MNVIRRALVAMLRLAMPRNIMLEAVQPDIAALSEVSAHLMVARAKLYTAIGASTASGLPLVMPESPGSLTLSNGYKLTIQFDRDHPTRMHVSVGTEHKDYTFELAVWEMLYNSPFFCGSNTTSDMVARRGLNHCLVVGIDTLTMAKNMSAMRAAGEEALLQS
jgi:hypothetical protein